VQSDQAVIENGMSRRDVRWLVVLCVCLAISLLLYVALAVVLGSVPPGWTSVVGFSLPSGELFRELTGLPRAELSPAAFSWSLGGGLALLWVLWLAAVLAAGQLSVQAGGRARLLVVVGGAAMLALVVGLVPPVLSSDLYRQASYGHMFARWGLNPYTTRAADVAWNPLLGFATQTQITTIYGPAYTLLSGLAAVLSPPTPLGAALAWKTMSAVAALGAALLAAPVARALCPARTDTWQATLLLLWNPLVVVESAGAGHVEAVMMLPALAGLLLLLRGRAIPGVAMLVLSTLTKWVTGILLALAMLHEIHHAVAGRRWSHSLWVVLAAALTAIACYAPFAGGLTTRGGIHELALHGGAPLGVATRTWVPEWAVVLAFAAATAVVARSATRGPWDRLVAAVTVLMLVFVVLVISWLFPWYLIAPAALAAVLPRDRQGFLVRLLCFGLGALAMLYYAKLLPTG
jgi:hypothetical protein